MESMYIYASLIAPQVTPTEKDQKTMQVPEASTKNADNSGEQPELNKGSQHTCKV